MSDLPASRVQPSRIFSVLGVDYTGSFLIKKFFKKHKAIHIELVTEMSTNSFLNAYKRLIPRRGLLSDVYSDNGTNFVGASHLINKIKDDVFQNILF